MAELRGDSAANRIQEQIREKLEAYKCSDDYPGRLPKLGIVRVGKNEDDLAYEKSALKRIDSLGMETEVFEFPENIENDLFLKGFRAVNEREDIDGILLFLPLPGSINEKQVLEILDPEKDLDGLTSANQARLYAGDMNGFVPCTADAVVQILKHAEIDLTGKNVAVLGRSIVIGKPVSMLLTAEDATVTMCHSKTADIKEICRRSDIVVAAVGRARMVDGDYIKDGSIVIDVGINVDPEGNLCGDVDYESASGKAALITPVPGGVGSVTTTILASHLLDAAIKGAKKK